MTPRTPITGEEVADVLREALERLLPYAQTEAGKAPTTDGRVKRMLQARKDRDFAIEALRSAATAARQQGEGK